MAPLVAVFVMLLLVKVEDTQMPVRIVPEVINITSQTCPSQGAFDAARN